MLSPTCSANCVLRLAVRAYVDHGHDTAAGLTTAAHGRFSDNFFIMGATTRTVNFVSFGDLDLAALSKTLRVEHVRTYL